MAVWKNSDAAGVSPKPIRSKPAAIRPLDQARYCAFVKGGVCKLFSTCGNRSFNQYRACWRSSARIQPEKGQVTDQKQGLFRSLCLAPFDGSAQIVIIRSQTIEPFINHVGVITRVRPARKAAGNNRNAGHAKPPPRRIRPACRGHTGGSSPASCSAPGLASLPSPPATY